MQLIGGVMTNGITIAGNILADVVKTVDVYPEIGMLSNISSVERSVGGCVPNTGIDIAKIDSTIKLDALGLVGNDDYGRFVVGELNKNGINTEGVKVTESANTSFSDVMSLLGGERTFFHSRGANALFCEDDIDIDALNTDMFHIGYILLLDKLDEEDKQYGTKMARLLSKVQAKGIKTSIDVVSDSSGNFKAKVMPALKYCDNIIINEIECCSIWGLEPTDKDGNLCLENIKKAMELTLNSGVKERVIVHCKQAGFMLSKAEGFVSVLSLNVPKEDIKGSVGAGDAYCAGCLYGIYKGFSGEEILKFASGAAACSLLEKNSVDGMKTAEEIAKIESVYPRRRSI